MKVVGVLSVGGSGDLHEMSNVEQQMRRVRGLRG